jgi:hypothetical protein
LRRFRIPEIMLGFGLGLIVSMFVVAIGSHQAERCRQQQESGTEKPSANDPVNLPISGGGRSQEPGHYNQEHPIACGIVGFFPALFSFMDDNEGAFVGSFTGLLFFATWLLWLKTRDLAEVGERIGQAQVRAYVDISSANIIFLQIAGGVALGEDSQPLVRITAKNTGQSPARNFIWHPTIQYGSFSEPMRSRYRHLGGNWREITGIGIPASGGEHTAGAMVTGMLLLRFLRESSLITNAVLLRARIQFEYEDVFERRIVDEAYFMGTAARIPNNQTVQTDFGMTQWGGQLHRIDRPNDWPPDTEIGGP